MDKQKILSSIRVLAAQGHVTREELSQAYEDGLLSTTQPEQPEIDSTLSRYSGILYYIGGGIVFLGLVFFVGQLWKDFGSFMRIFITLGTGIAAYIVGVLFDKQHRLGAAGPAFFMISALLIPTGIMVTLDEFNFRLAEDKIQTLISGLLFVTYLLSFYLFKRMVLLIFSIFFASWLYFAFCATILNHAAILPDINFVEYIFMAFGLSYLFLGHELARRDIHGIPPTLYFIGINCLLAAAFSLTGWKPAQSVFWELLYPGIIFGGFYVSAIIHSKIILSFSTLYLAAYLTKLTVEYFRDSLGWPVTLILSGFVLMGIAYLAIHLKRKYQI